MSKIRMRIGKIRNSHIFLLFAMKMMLIRLFYSVELTDEAYGIAEIYNASLGHKPIIDIWDPHTGWYLYTPFMVIYRALVPNLSGVVLFFRILYFVLVLLVLGVSCRFLSTAGGAPELTRLATIGCITYVSFSMPSMGYNAVISFLLILAFALLKRQENGESAFMLGLLFGVCCLIYPTLAAMAILMVPMLSVYRRKRKYIILYSVGVTTAAALFYMVPGRRNPSGDDDRLQGNLKFAS